MKNLQILLIVIPILFFSAEVYSGHGDTINIYSHKKTKVITDPSKGFNSYKSNINFPSEDINYRKVILKITYQCPDSQKCGEWDYIDYIYFKKKSGEDTSRIEIARLISPYGSRFLPEWKFSWKDDITDFGFLLHDSAEIEFIHTGYESNTDRGWLISIDFEFTEGIPAIEAIGYEKLWEGIFPYGDAKDDIQNYLKPFIFKNEKADFAELRILQTGHGMDDFENCAEFCSKWRNIYFDNELINQKQIWRECADNPLYPQAGTWIFDRAGWCPGALVKPDKYYFDLNQNFKELSEHIIRLEIEPYVNPNKPSANYVFSSYLFYYKKSKIENDISLEEIISPSTEDIYSRKNPSAGFPVIVVKNNAGKVLESFTALYGAQGNQTDTFQWSGKIDPNESLEIILPGKISGKDNKNIFNVILSQPNNADDEYPYDNSGNSEFINPPVLDTKLIVYFKTNKEPSHNYFQLKNLGGFISEQKAIGKLKPDSLYIDTLSLRKGSYEIILGDTANDGLDFWFNPEGGYGYLRITDIDGKLIKAFNSDFGKEIRHQFIVTGEKPYIPDITPLLNIFPVRNPGKFFCDIFLNEKKNITIFITTEDKKKTVFKKNYRNFKEGIVNIDLTKVKDGTYFVNLISGDKTVTKKMKIKRD